MKAFLQPRRKRTIALVSVIAALAIAGGAFAAWILLTGVGGSGGGKVGSSQISPAITLTPHFVQGDAAVIPGSAGDVYADVTNNSVQSSETVTSLSMQSITASPSCNTSALSFTPDDNFLNHQWGQGTTVMHFRIGTLTAAQNLDPACANADLTLNFAGTTNP